MTQLPKQLHQQMHLLMDNTFLYDVSTYSWVNIHALTRSQYYGCIYTENRLQSKCRHLFP